MVSLIKRDYLLSACYETNTELHASIARISLNLHNNLQENPHPPPCPLSPFYTGRNQDSMRVKYFLKSMASKWSGAVRKSIWIQNPSSFLCPSLFLFSWGKWLIKDKLHILGHSLLQYFSINQRSNMFLNTLLRTMPDTVKILRMFSPHEGLHSLAKGT